MQPMLICILLNYAGVFSSISTYTQHDDTTKNVILESSFQYLSIFLARMERWVKFIDDIGSHISEFNFAMEGKARSLNEVTT